jgi:hypothetical protein
MEYSLWKATRKIKQPKQQIPSIRKSDNNWARNDQQKATTFAEHLCAVFQPFPSQLPAAEQQAYKQLETPFQMALPINKINQ